MYGRRTQYIQSRGGYDDHDDDQKGVSCKLQFKYVSGTLPLIHRQTSDRKSAKEVPLAQLWVHAYASSEFMTPERGPRDRAHARTQPMSNAQHTCDMVLPLKSVVPDNVLVHIHILTEDLDAENGQFHRTMTTLARAQVSLQQVMEKGFVTAECLDAYRCEPNDDVGKIVVSRHAQTAVDVKTASAFRAPEWKGTIPRMSRSEWESGMWEYITTNYDAIWKRYPSAVTYPMFEKDGVYKASPRSEYHPTVDGPMPDIFYYAQASRMNVADVDHFADMLIRLACLCMRVAPDGLDALTDEQRLPVLCCAVQLFPQLLGSTYDRRGSAYNLPLAAESIDVSSSVCVELATLCGVATRAIRRGSSARCRVFHTLLNQVYTLCYLLCTNRAGKTNGANSSPSRHIVACLVPRVVLEGKDNKSAWRPQLLNAMGNHDFDADRARTYPGAVSDSEPLLLKADETILPAQYTQRDLMDRAKTPYYGSCIKLYDVEDNNTYREFTFIRNGKVGLDCFDFFRGINISLVCPIPLDHDSRAVALARTAWNETRHLTNVWPPTAASPNPVITDATVDEWNKTDRKGGWRYAFYSVGQESSLEKEFKRQLAQDVARLDKKYNVQTQILGKYTIVYGVEVYVVLLTYSL